MNNEEFRNEKLYLTTMNIVKKMMEEKIISRKDYNEVRKKMQEKYNPVSGNIVS